MKKPTKNKKSASKKIAKKTAKKTTKKSAKKTPAKKQKRARPFSVKFSAPKEVNDRARRVFEFLNKNGPSTIKEIADAVFVRKPKRKSWVRNQLRVLRGFKVVNHSPRIGDQPAKYSAAAKSSLPEKAFKKETNA